MAQYPLSARTAIRGHLQEIATAAGESRVRTKSSVQKQPALCVYDFEGFQLTYQVDPGTRRVVVLDLWRSEGTGVRRR